MYINKPIQLLTLPNLSWYFLLLVCGCMDRRVTCFPASLLSEKWEDKFMWETHHILLKYV